MISSRPGRLRVARRTPAFISSNNPTLLFCAVLCEYAFTAFLGAGLVKRMRNRRLLSLADSSIPGTLFVDGYADLMPCARLTTDGLSTFRGAPLRALVQVPSTGHCAWEPAYSAIKAMPQRSDFFRGTLGKPLRSGKTSRRRHA
jgi:hypothetical protein